MRVRARPSRRLLHAPEVYRHPWPHDDIGERQLLNPAEAAIYEEEAAVVDVDRLQVQHLAIQRAVQNEPLSGGLTNPETVYVLRWMAGRHAGIPEFEPPFTIEPV